MVGENAHSLTDLLRLAAEQEGHRRAYTMLTDGESERQHVTYAQLDRRARAIAAKLQAMELTGERALIVCPSGLDFIATFFGCLYAGVVAVPAYPPRRNRNLKRVESIAEDARPRVVLSTGDAFERLEPVLRDVPHLAGVPFLNVADFPDSEAEHWRPTPTDGSTLAFLQYTSGSTGKPKGVMLSHGNLLHNTRIISEGFGSDGRTSGVTWLPLFHDMGLIGGIIQPLYFRCPMTLLSPSHFLQKPVRWLRAISDVGATISGGPNFAYELCVERVSDDEKAQLDLSTWEVAFNGAEPVRAETLDRFSQAFAVCGFRRKAPYPCYGLAEATLMVTGGNRQTAPPMRSFEASELQEGALVEASPENSDALRLVSSGRSLLEQEVLIVDPETCDEVADRTVGEVWVRGPSVAQGYWQQADLSKATFGAMLKDGRGPFLRTGDLGSLDQGELFINGRLKDLIILRGVNHYPQDLEQTVEQSHADLRPAAGAAFAVGDQGAERLVIVHEITRKREIDFQAVCNAIVRDLARMHEVTPSEVVLIWPHSIPLTSSGKIQRHACREAFAQASLKVVAEWRPRKELKVHQRGSRPTSARPTPTPAAVSPTPVTTYAVPHNIAERVMAVVRSVANERAAGLSLKTDIIGMGLDSLERMEIVAGLEQEFGGRFSEDAIAHMETCGDVVEQVQRCLLDKAATSPSTELQPGDYCFTKSPEYLRLAGLKAQTEATGLGNPFFTQHEGLTNDTATIAGREYINFCSYNYLGMSGDPAVHEAAKRAIDQFGTSVSASRLVSGEKTVHRDLEREIADFLGVEDAITFVGGHATNETVIGHLFGPGDLILHDALSHNSIVQGCKLSGAQRRAFPHNDYEACERLLERYRHEYRQVLIVVEGVYSMDGDQADVARLVEIKQRHKAYLMVDEAHSIGTMGSTGRGMSEHAGIDPRSVDLWMGTMSKSLGSCGGYIAASHAIVEYLKYTAPGFVFSVGLPPANAAASLAALRLLQAEPERVSLLQKNAELFLSRTREAGLNTGASHATPIVPVITGNSELALRLSHALFVGGVNVQPILHPAVEESAVRLRFFLTSTHTKEQILRTVGLLATAWEALTGHPTKREGTINGAGASEPRLVPAALHVPAPIPRQPSVGACGEGSVVA